MLASFSLIWAYIKYPALNSDICGRRASCCPHVEHRGPSLQGRQAWRPLRLRGIFTLWKSKALLGVYPRWEQTPSFPSFERALIDTGARCARFIKPCRDFRRHIRHHPSFDSSPDWRCLSPDGFSKWHCFSNSCSHWGFVLEGNGVQDVTAHQGIKEGIDIHWPQSKNAFRLDVLASETDLIGFRLHCLLEYSGFDRLPCWHAGLM